MGLLDGGNARSLSDAQHLWDRDQRSEAIDVLQKVVPDLMPRLFATDALIIARLASFCMESGDPHRGLKLIETLPMSERPRTETQATCLGVRCCCRAATGDLAGAHDDRAAIFRAQPSHPALLQADEAIREARRSLLSRATITRPNGSSL